MKTNIFRLNILAIVLLSVATFAPLFASAKNFTVEDVTISGLKNGTAVLSWKTPNVKTTGLVYVGANEQLFDRTYRYDTYAYAHQVTLARLDADKTYYYKIIAADKEGTVREMFVRSFSTGDMADTVKPEFLECSVISNDYGAIVLRWATDEKATAVIEYGSGSDTVRKKVYFSGYVTSQEATLGNLKSGTRYTIKITVSDQSGNSSSKTLTSTVGSKSKDAALVIGDIEPAFYGSDRITANTARIGFSTSLPAKSRIRYGTTAKSLTKTVVVSDKRNVEHEVIIGGLLPNTTYYYKIEIYESLFGKSTASDVLSFSTGNVTSRYAGGSLVRAIGDDKVYFIYKDKKSWVVSPSVFLGLGFKSEWVRDVPASTLADYKEGKSISVTWNHPSGSLVKYADRPTVYLIESNTKRPIASAEVFAKNGYDWNRVITISDRETYSTGEYVN